MALVVEDGTLIANAESYLSVADADIIVADRGGSTYWTGLSTTEKEVQLRLATEYIDRRCDFIGYLVDINQALAWPRSTETDRYSDTDIPLPLKKALAVLAMQSEALYLTVTGSGINGTVKSQFDKLDVLETKTEYFSGGFNSAQTSFTEVDSLLVELCEASGTIYRG